MGNFYKNVTIVGAEQAAIVASLERHGRIAYVTPSRTMTTVVFDREADAAADPLELGDVALTLSQDLSCLTLAAAVYDDDVLLLGAYANGAQVGEYNSCSGGTLTAAVMRRLLTISRARAGLLWVVLTAPRLPLFLFETWRHFLILRILGMPPWAGATGYRYVHQGESPPDLEADDLTHVGESRPWDRRGA